jgi:hypothetical protein
LRRVARFFCLCLHVLQSFFDDMVRMPKVDEYLPGEGVSAR